MHHHRRYFRRLIRHDIAGYPLMKHIGLFHGLLDLHDYAVAGSADRSPRYALNTDAELVFAPVEVELADVGTAPDTELIKSGNDVAAAHSGVALYLDSHNPAGEVECRDYNDDRAYEQSEAPAVPQQEGRERSVLAALELQSELLCERGDCPEVAAVNVRGKDVLTAFLTTANYAFAVYAVNEAVKLLTLCAYPDAAPQLVFHVQHRPFPQIRPARSCRV